MSDGPSIRFDRHELVTIDRPRYTGRVVEDNGPTLRVQLWAPTMRAWHFTVTVDRSWIRAFDPALSPTPDGITDTAQAA